MPGGIIQHFASEGDLVIAVNNDVVWRSTDQGHVWEEIGGGPWLYALSDVAVEEGVIWLASSYEGAFRSVDGGDSWEIVKTGLGTTAGMELVTGGETMFAVNPNYNTLYRWSEADQSWSTLKTPGGSYVGGAAAKGTRLYVSMTGTGAFYYSEDSGDTFTKGGTGGPTTLYQDPLADNDVLIGVTQDLTKLRRSDDLGLSWTTAGNCPAYLYLGTLTSREGILYATSTWEGLLRSEDGGATWTASNEGFPTGEYDRYIYDVEVTDDGAMITAPYSNGIYRSEDGGSSWEPSGSGIAGGTISGVVWMDGAFYISNIHAEVWRYDPGTGEWTDQGDPTSTAGIISLGRVGDTLVAGAGYDGGWASTDQGVTWSEVSGLATYNGTAGEQVREVAWLEARGGTMFAGYGSSFEGSGEGTSHTTGGGIARSQDGGLSWMSVNSGVPEEGWDPTWGPYYSPMSVVRPYPDRVLAGSLWSGILQSLDRGDTWAAIDGAVAEDASVYDFAHVDGVYYAATGSDTVAEAASYGVSMSTDEGATWTSISDGLPVRHSVKGLAAAADGSLFCLVTGTEDGIYRLEGETWSRVASAEEFDLSPPLVIAEDHMVVGSMNHGLLRLQPD